MKKKKGDKSVSFFFFPFFFFFFYKYVEKLLRRNDEFVWKRSPVESRREVTSGYEGMKDIYDGIHLGTDEYLERSIYSTKQRSRKRSTRNRLFELTFPDFEFPP